MPNLFDNSSSEHGIPLLTLGLVTDIHYGPRSYGDRDCPGALERLASALQGFALFGVPLVVNLGDAIDGPAGVSEAVDLCAQIRKTFAAYPGQVLHVLGNHDVQALSKETFLAHLGRPLWSYYCIDAGPAYCIVLDGNCHQDGADFCRGNFAWDQAWIDEQQLRWLERTLTGIAGRPALVFCHECLDNTEVNGSPDPHVVGNADVVRNLLRQANVRAVFQGHYHYGRRRIVDDIPYYTIPAGAVARNTEEFATMATLYADGTVWVTGVGE